MRHNKETKIVVLGAYNSGKTTTLEQICHNRAKVEYNGTTTALDYGNTMINGKKSALLRNPRPGPLPLHAEDSLRRPGWSHTGCGQQQGNNLH
nr:GTPase [Methanobacterium formicicum]